MVLESAGKRDHTGGMDKDSTLQHETTLEHALDVAKANHKEAVRLLEGARAAYKTGDVGEDRVRQLEGLLAIAEEDLRRVMREQ
jgi:outer membrane protein TolC